VNLNVEMISQPIIRFSLSEDPVAVKGLIGNGDRKVCGELKLRRKANQAAGKVEYILSDSRTKPFYSYGF
jgi:hypothetical protein